MASSEFRLASAFSRTTNSRGSSMLCRFFRLFTLALVASSTSSSSSIQMLTCKVLGATREGELGGDGSSRCSLTSGDGTWQRLFRERLLVPRGKLSSSLARRSTPVPLEELFSSGDWDWDCVMVECMIGVESRRRLRGSGEGGSGMDRKSKQSSTLNSDKKCEDDFGVAGAAL